MIKNLKTLAIAMLVTGATVTATKAPAAKLNTNAQVLDNISVALTVYSQSPTVKTTRNGKNEKQVAVVSKINTSDIIYQLGQIGGFSVNPKKDKLVLSTTFSNFLVGIPGTTVLVSSNTLTNVPNGEVWYWQDPYGESWAMDLSDGATYTNTFLITNSGGAYGEIFQLSSATSSGTTYFPLPDAQGNGGNYYDSIYTNDVFTATNTFPPGTSTNAINFGPLYGTNLDGTRSLSQTLSYWVVLTPTVSGTNVNVTITQYSPQTEEVFAYADPVVCVMTPKSSGTPASLILVSNWVQWNSGSVKIYDDTGTDLATNDFDELDITSETVYTTGGVEINTTYPETGAPSTQTNLNLNLNGFAKGSATRMNLLLNGKASNALDVLSLSSQSVGNGVGTGYIGGTFTTNFDYPSSTNAADVYIYSYEGSHTNYETNNAYTNYTYNTEITNLTGREGNYIGATFVTNAADTNFPYGQFVQNPTNVLVTGTVTLTYLNSLTESNIIVPVQP